MVALAACSNAAAGGPGPSTSSASTAGSPTASAPPSRSTSASPTSASPTRPAAPPTLRPPAEPGLVWRAQGTSTSRGPATYLARIDGGAITLMWINAPAVSFRLIPGLAVPEGGPVTAADRSPSTWVPRMVAAFNGGFLLKDGVGGYYFDHQMVRSMKPGFGALEITADGRLSVGAWGRDLTLTAQTVAVRQNMPLLVDRYQAQTRPTDTASTWGIANGGLWTANRSALGQLADGSLVFAFGANVRPAEMAASMVIVRAKEAMLLDMNKSWPGGFVYEHPASGIVGQRIHPLEWHSPSVYYARFTKDFIAVLLR
jgi:Phosphodiester glycosidase